METELFAEDDAVLLQAARDAAANAYAPYSHFKVGAAVRTQAGGLFTGCNVENASYSIVTCAERNAIAAAVLAEGPEMKIAAIAVAAQPEKTQAVSLTPCGACRQAIHEMGKSARVIFADTAGKTRAMSIEHLLPEAFAL